MLASLARQDDRPELKRDSPFRRFKYGVLDALVLSMLAFSLRGGVVLEVGVTVLQLNLL